MARLLSLNECEACDGSGQVADVDPEGGFVHCRDCGGSGEAWGAVADGGPTTTLALTPEQRAVRHGLKWAPGADLLWRAHRAEAFAAHDHYRRSGPPILVP